MAAVNIALRISLLAPGLERDWDWLGRPNLGARRKALVMWLGPRDAVIPAVDIFVIIVHDCV